MIETMKIRNFDQLATTPLRKQALAIIEAGYEAIGTEEVISNSVKLDGNNLQVRDKTLDLSHFENIYVVAIGKCALAASKALEKILGDKISKGYCLDIRQEPLTKIETFLGTHPLPSQTNIDATKKIIELLKSATENDLILTVVSGGGSALLSAPYKIDFQTKALISNELMKAGANIQELNIVRKHLSEIKGGRFAALAYPATFLSLIFSDVPGNDLSTIASGITVIDRTTISEAEAVLKKFDIYNRTKLDKIELSETPKEEKFFEKVTNLVLVDSQSALVAMSQKAKAAGFNVIIISDRLQGEAAEVGQQLLTKSVPQSTVLAAGETTVSVKGKGEGGRNQTLVLSNLANIGPNQVLISVGSDGHDHSDFAGAIGDRNSVNKAKGRGLDPQDYLSRSDSYHFFQKLGDGIDTGLLDSNISDFMLVLQSDDKD